MHCRYKSICKNYGCKCKVFTQCPGNLKGQIGCPDLVILFTNTVAHKMVSVAAEQAAKSNAKIARCHSSSASALKDILENYFAEEDESGGKDDRTTSGISLRSGTGRN